MRGGIGVVLGRALDGLGAVLEKYLKKKLFSHLVACAIVCDWSRARNVGAF